jgi:hypothetical protein
MFYSLSTTIDNATYLLDSLRKVFNHCDTMFQSLMISQTRGGSKPAVASEK